MGTNGDAAATDREAWLERRRGGIGASEAPVVLGLSGSRLRLYLEKRGELGPGEPTEAMQWGLWLEDDLAAAYERKTGRTIAAVQQFHAHPAWPRMLATIDAVTACGRVVEFKSVGPHGHGARLGEEGDSSTLPDEWVAQVNQQLCIAGALGLADPDEGDIIVFGPGLRSRIYPVWRSDEVVAGLVGSIGRFWADHVEAGVPPADLAREDRDYVSRLFRGRTGEMLRLDGDTWQVAVRYHDTCKALKALEEEREQLLAELKMAVGDAAGAHLLGGWRILRSVRDIEARTQTIKAHQQVRITVKEPSP